MSIHIAFCANDRFLPGLAVALHSVICCLPEEEKAEIHVVDAGLSEESKLSLSKRYVDSPLVNLEFLTWPRELFEGVKVVRYHISSYLRLSLPELVRARRLIYLDSDTVVFDDIMDLVRQSELATFPIAAVADWETTRPSQDSKVIAKHLNVEDCESYFNAGVLVLDLDILRRERFSSCACDLLSELGEHASFADQTAFNCLMAERWFELSSKWNTPSWVFDRQQKNSLPAILHYTNSAPWLHRRFTPSQALFERIAVELEVTLPKPEISLARSCTTAVILWLIAPARVGCHLLRGLRGWLARQKEGMTGSFQIATYWTLYFTGGPLRVIRYWQRIREIKNFTFDLLPRKSK